MVHADEFAQNQKDSVHRTFYVNNNPLFAPRHHPVIRLALARATGLVLNHSGASRFDIQDTTGPGNLTQCLITHAIAAESAGQPRDFELLINWEAVALSRWPLSYRKDERNWRIWDPAA